MRLRDLPGLVEKAEKVYTQFMGYVARVPKAKKKKRPGFHP